MTHRHVFDAVDRSLRDLRKTLRGVDQPFGGIPVVLGGDFLQILPVIPHGGRQDSVAASIQHSAIWPSSERLSLTQKYASERGYDPVTYNNWKNKHLVTGALVELRGFLIVKAGNNRTITVENLHV